MTDAKPDSSDSEQETLDHKELLEVTSGTLAKLLSGDPLLKDLPVGVTVEEVNAQIALHHGQAMTVYIVRGDNDEMPVVVSHASATVRDLKDALVRHMTLRLKRQKSSITVSWPYIWRTYWLAHDSQLLIKDSSLLSDYGICNKSRVVFRKRYREKARSAKGRVGYSVIS